MIQKPFKSIFSFSMLLFMNVTSSIPFLLYFFSPIILLFVLPLFPTSSLFFFPLFPNSFFGLRKEQTHPLWLRKEQNPKIKIPFIKWLNIEIIWICTLRHINARNSWLLICSFQPNIYVGSMDI